jgi:hypothetical protein
MTKVLFDASLCERDFGKQALRVGALKDWAGTLPATVPDVHEFDVVQIESLLCAIERGTTALYAKADDQVLIDEALKVETVDPKVRKLIEEGSHQLARWLLSAGVHVVWRQRITAALEKGELRSIDSLTMLPAEDDGQIVQASAQKFVKRSEQNSTTLLNAVAACGLVATSLPKEKNGAHNSAKSKVKTMATTAGMSTATFNSTWQSLRKSGALKEASE